MTPEDHAFQNQECCDDAAAYALGALDPSEAAEFRRHLETCIICSDEIAAFEGIADALAMAAPPHPVPHGLRRKIMRGVRAELRTAAPPNRRHRAHSRSPRRFVARPALVGGLLAAGALAVIGGLELAPGGSTRIRVIQARVIGRAGSARLSVAGAHAELIVNHLPPASAGRVYEVWIDRAGHAPSPRALFSLSASGGADVRVPGDLRGASTIMVTQERAGGSLVPTEPPVIVAMVS